LVLTAWFLPSAVKKAEETALEGAKPGALIRISPVSAERLTQSAPDCWAEAKGMVCATAHAERSEMAGLNFINLMIDSGRVNSGRVNSGRVNRRSVNLERKQTC